MFCVAGVRERTVDFTASAILTDNLGQTSLTTSCTQTVVVTAASTSSQTGGNPVVTAPATQPTPLSPKTALGPGDTFVKAGAIGGIVSVVGAILFFAL